MLDIYIRLLGRPNLKIIFLRITEESVINGTKADSLINGKKIKKIEQMYESD